jgi:cyanophycinase
VPGPLALVGGGEWTDGCDFDKTLLEASGATEVVVLPTAAAYEHPARVVDRAVTWFAGLGVGARGVDVLRRPDAAEPSNVEAVRGARFIYLAGGSPMHLRSVLKDSPVWDALVAAWTDGAALAGSSAGAMVLCDPMVDPRGGAFTLGLGLAAGLTVVPHHDQWSADKLHRTLQLAPKGLAVVGVDERTALVRLDGGRGGWQAAGAGGVHAWRDGQAIELADLP